MSEWTMILVMTWCSALFAIGGTKGKYFRRYVLPLGLAVIAVLSGVVWWKVVGLTLSLIIALSAGYGSSSPYWKKALVFSSYGLVFLWLGFSYWVIITPVLCLSMFVLSNWKPLANTFFWKAVEFLYGALIGITFISVIK